MHFNHFDRCLDGIKFLSSHSEMLADRLLTNNSQKYQTTRNADGNNKVINAAQCAIDETFLFARNKWAFAYCATLSLSMLLLLLFKCRVYFYKQKSYNDESPVNSFRKLIACTHTHTHMTTIKWNGSVLSVVDIPLNSIWFQVSPYHLSYCMCHVQKTHWHSRLTLVRSNVRPNEE